jgi:hypothetical protein
VIVNAGGWRDAVDAPLRADRHRDGDRPGASNEEWRRMKIDARPDLIAVELLPRHRKNRRFVATFSNEP